MSRTMTARLARKSTSWLLFLLCITLLAWRIDFRIEQCQPSSVSAPATVAFFDVNERNAATLNETHFNVCARFAADQPRLLVVVDPLAVSTAHLMETDRRRLETPPLLSGLFAVSIPLLPNPPPTPLA
jgi:hypothetical protein